MSEKSRTLVVLVGSLRQASVNRRIAALAAQSAPDDVDVQIVDDLSVLPYYNQDLDEDGARGDAVEGLRAQVAAADAILIVTPEYNGGLPAVLKNAIDWLSRPYGNGAFTGKPVGVIGSALSAHAGAWVREQTRRSVGIAGGRVLEEVDLGVRSGEFDGADGVPAGFGDAVSEVLATLLDAVGAPA